MAEKEKDNEAWEIPDHVIHTFARCLLPEIQNYFESEEGKKEFEEWKKRQNRLLKWR